MVSFIRLAAVIEKAQEDEIFDAPVELMHKASVFCCRFVIYVI